MGPAGLFKLPRRAAGHRHLPSGEPGISGAKSSGPVRTRRQKVAYPDTLVGTDSHTTMINGLGVLGWGVGGIEAEAVMLGQPVSMLIPEVVGFQTRRQMAEGHDRAPTWY